MRCGKVAPRLHAVCNRSLSVCLHCREGRLQRPPVPEVFLLLHETDAVQVLQELTGTTLNDRIIIAISSITKMFVGELIETGEQATMRSSTRA